MERLVSFTKFIFYNTGCAGTDTVVHLYYVHASCLAHLTCIFSSTYIRRMPTYQVDDVLPIYHAEGYVINLTDMYLKITNTNMQPAVTFGINFDNDLNAVATDDMRSGYFESRDMRLTFGTMMDDDGLEKGRLVIDQEPVVEGHDVRPVVAAYIGFSTKLVEVLSLLAKSISRGANMGENSQNSRNLLNSLEKFKKQGGGKKSKTLKRKQRK